MKINPISPQVLLQSYGANKTQATQQAPPQRMDQVELTGGAQSFADAMRAVKESMQAQNADDARRVDDLRKQVQDGTYNVSSRQVAEKMIEDLFY